MQYIKYLYVKYALPSDLSLLLYIFFYLKNFKKRKVFDYFYNKYFNVNNLVLKKNKLYLNEIYD